MKFIGLCRVSLFVFFISFSFLSNAQIIKEYKKLAQYAYEKGDYKVAMDNYFQAYLKDTFDIESLYYYAESAKEFQSFEKARDAYSQLLTMDMYSDYLSVLFDLASIYKYLGEYDSAFHYFEKYTELYPNEGQIQYQKALFEVEHREDIIKIVSDTNKNRIIKHFDVGINSDYSEFSPAYYGDQSIYLASLRLPIEEEGQGNIALAYHTFKILKFENQMGPWVKKDMDAPITFKKNKEKHIGNYNKVNDSIALFTVCNSNSASALVCNIFIKRGEKKAHRLSGINQVNSSTTQPFMFEDKGKWKVYFSSNRLGGYGGSDIWMASLDNSFIVDSIWNCGEAINTKGNEYSPFLDLDSNKLFFSSDWHPGLGGLDIFESRKIKDNEYDKPKNLANPINTSLNELDFSWHKNHSKGLFVSNRRGSFFVNGEYCCHDVYEVNIVSDSDLVAMQKQYEYVEDYDALEPNYEDSVKIDTVPVKPSNFDKVYYPVTDSYIELKYPTIYFDFNSFKLNEMAINTLDSVISILLKDSIDQVELAAHTDGKGSDMYNLRLSQKRASYVQDYLIQNGVDSSYISFGFYGESEPVAPNSFKDGRDNPEGRKLNRRVELRYYKKEE